MICKFCQKLKENIRPDAIYCSRECQLKAYHEKHRERLKKYHQQYWIENGEKVKETKKRYYKKNKVWLNQITKDWKKRNALKTLVQSKIYYEKNRSDILDKSQKYQKENLKKIIKQRLKRMEKDIHYKLRCMLSCNVRQAIKRNSKLSKMSSTLDLVGADIHIVREHIEKQFKEGMTWDNHGKWHIDHIIPCASFDLTKESEQKRCFNYRNLQPLWANENMSKQDKTPIITIHEEVVADVRTRDNHCCVYCGAKRDSLNKLENSFIFPIGKEQYVVTACYKCNRIKSNHNLDDFFATTYCINKGINRETVNPIIFRLESEQDGQTKIE